MAVHATRFRLRADHARGARALDALLEGLGATLPYARLTHLEVDHRRFAVATERFPDAIWHQLLTRTTWHAKLVSHLLESVRPAAVQERLLVHLKRPHVRVGVVGMCWFDDASTPGLLTEVILPELRRRGLRLTVEAFRPRRLAPSPEALKVMLLQRHLYRTAARS